MDAQLQNSLLRTFFALLRAGLRLTAVRARAAVRTRACIARTRVEATGRG